jgi:hypothetical protein
MADKQKDVLHFANGDVEVDREPIVEHDPARRRAGLAADHPSSPKREADKYSEPGPNDAEPNDPPLRTNRPDQPMIQSLATGAGQHKPLDDSEFDSDGRFAGKTPDAAMADGDDSKQRQVAAAAPASGSKR